MWMMGYNDGGDIYMADSFNNGRKLRPLVPRPNGGGGNDPPPCFGRLHHGSDVFSLTPNNIGMMSEPSKREFINPQHHQVVVSSRWNPTPEQLRTLEELYRHGTRTPSAEQIQHITAQLRRYGKIEGKNVFYWFQNHKARERQKRRRQMESSEDHQNGNGRGAREIETLGRKETAAEGASKTVLGVDHHHHHQTNKSPNNNMNCSTLPEEHATSTLEKTVKSGGGGPDRKSSSSSSENHHHHWMKINENAGSDSQNTSRNVMNDTMTWQMMQRHQYISCPPPPHPTTHLINTPRMDPKLINSNNKCPNNNNNHHLTSFIISPPQISPYHRNIIQHEEFFVNPHLLNASDGDEDEEGGLDHDYVDNSQTLQLFPLRSGDGGGYGNEKETEMSVSAINYSFAAHPHQFFEFLPLKN